MAQQQIFPGRKNREQKSAAKHAAMLESMEDKKLIPQWPTRSQVELPGLGGMVELVYEDGK